jgi:hypothetical protein
MEASPGGMPQGEMVSLIIQTSRHLPEQSSNQGQRALGFDLVAVLEHLDGAERFV